jgi:glyoxylase-like metal-dependent hydrolase (beta-lactamase superfamily II)
MHPGDVKLIVVTHVHFDHVGSLSAIKAACRCPVVVHAKEYRLLKEAELVFPPGTNLSGKGTSLVANRLRGYPPIMRGFKFAPVEAEIVVSGEVALEKFGVAGKIIPTPGHTAGSLSVLLADGEAFVGDLTANYVPLWAQLRLPALRRGWRRAFGKLDEIIGGRGENDSAGAWPNLQRRSPARGIQPAQALTRAVEEQLL